MPPEAVAGLAVRARLDPLGAGGGEHHREVVPPLPVPGGEDLPLGRLAQEPLQGGVPLPAEVGGEPRPVEVHVHRQGRGRGVGGQPALLPSHLGQGESGAPQVAGDGEVEVAGVAQLDEVLVEEAVLPVVRRRALPEALEQGV